MDAALDPLILDLLEWIGPRTRPYGEVLEAWRTSCPRLPLWEEADQRGFVTRSVVPEAGRVVSVSPRGQAFLRRHRTPAAHTGGTAPPAPVR